MALVLANAHQLRPDVNLAQAFHEFERNLSDAQKIQLRSEGVPDASAAIKLTARIDNECYGRRTQCLGSRVTTFLESVRQLSAVADTFVSAHPELAALVWGGVKLTLLAANNVSSYFENLSALLMSIGRQCPRMQGLGSLYPTKGLQRALCDYMATILRLCKHIMDTFQKSAYSQLSRALFFPFKAEFGSYENEIKTASQAVRDEVTLASEEAQRMEHELQARERSKNSRSRDVISRLWDNTSQNNEHNRKWILAHRARKLEGSKMEILDLLSTYDYQKTFRRIRKECMPGTSQWIYSDPAFREWIGGPTKTMWFTGKLGSGKSVSCTCVVTHLTETLSARDVTSYFFCRFDDQDSLQAETILGAIYRQLVQHLPGEAFEKINQERNSRISMIDSLKTILSPQKQYFIVLDGLEECEKVQAKEVIDHLQDLLTHSDLRMKVFWTSRPHVASWFPKRLLAESQISSGSAENKEKVTSDIQEYVRVVIEGWQEDEEFPSQCSRTKVVSIVQDHIGRKAGGMFLWAKLQLETIKEELTNDKILSALENLPQDLSETFRRVLSPQVRLDKDGIGKSIFRWIAVAKRPLTVEELREAISIQPLQKTWNSNCLINDMGKVIAFCGNLVLVDEECDTVHFTHSSARQFLVSTTISDIPSDYCVDLKEANMWTGALCVTYLNLPTFDRQVARINRTNVSAHDVVSTVIKTSAPSKTIANRFVMAMGKRAIKSDKSAIRLFEEACGENEESRKQKFLQEYCFLPYATCFWLEHSMHGLRPDSSEMWALFRNLITDAGWRNTLSDVPWTSRDFEDCSSTFLNWVVEHGQVSLIYLLSDGFTSFPQELLKRLEVGAASVDDENTWALVQQLGDMVQSILNSSLRRFAASGHEDRVINLLSRGADVNHRDELGRTTLMITAKEAYPAVLNRLLLAGADVNCQDHRGWTAFHHAASRWRVVIEAGLARARVDADDPSEHGIGVHMTVVPLTYLSIFTMLSTAGFNINCKVNFGRAILHHAAEKGQTIMVHELLKVGAEINEQTEDGKTALMIATSQGHLGVVGWLLQAGADIDYLDRMGWTVLHYAAQIGQAVMVTRLLEVGVSIDFQSNEGETALMVAVSEGHSDASERLLQVGAKVHCRNKRGWTALHYAALLRDPDIAEQLLRAGAHCNRQCTEGQTPLFFAANAVNLDVMDSLLTAGADVHHQDIHGCTALHYAARTGSPILVNRLLSLGADRRLRNHDNEAAITWALNYDCVEVVAILKEAAP